MGIDQYEPHKGFSSRLDNQHQSDYDMKIQKKDDFYNLRQLTNFLSVLCHVREAEFHTYLS